MTSAERSEIERLSAAARAAVAAASGELLARFRRRIDTRTKADGSLVTEADHAAEGAILAVLREQDPGAAILTEESGAHDGAHASAERRWIVDPLDGTSRFARAHRAWGPLIACEREGQVVACALAMPALDEAYWAGLGLGAWRGDERLTVSAERDWSRSILAMGALPRLLQAPCADGVLSLARSCAYAAAGGDLTGATLVASGRAEVWIECGVQPWDIAPMGLLVTEAGGRATNLSGHARMGAHPGGSSAILVSNSALHDHALAAILGGA
ncbi:MAG: inositol monophosphatase family protein [Phycisphaerales bacterium]